MRRLISILVVVVMLVALCVPALAAGSPTGGDTTPADTQPGGPAAPAAGVSPQTGYDTILWGLCALAMIGCAGICFASTRKKVEE